MSWRSRGMRMLSRVVPGWSNTTTRSSPSNALTRVDLPTLGRPATAMRGAPSSAGASSCTCGTFARARCIRPCRPSPCAAESATGTPRPREWKSAVASTGSMPSVLLTASMTCLPRRRRPSAMPRSMVLMPARPSVRKIMASASAMACWVCTDITARRASVSCVIPPVSTTIYGRSPTRPLPYWRSRVRPGSSATRASRLRVNALNSVDLPTLGRPTRTMTGFIDQRLGCRGDGTVYGCALRRRAVSVPSWL